MREMESLKFSSVKGAKMVSSSRKIKKKIKKIRLGGWNHMFGLGFDFEMNLESAIDQVREEAKESGIAKATVKGLKDEGVSDSAAVLKGVPLQTGDKNRGLFVMAYMKEICSNKEIQFSTKWQRRNNLSYGLNDLNEIRCEWAKYFMKHHAN